MSEQKDTTLWDLIKSACRWLVKSAKAFVNWLGKQLRITLRKWYLVLPITILGIVAGFYYSRIENRKYKVEGLAIIHGPMATEVSEAIRPLTCSMPLGIQPSLSLADALECPVEYTLGIRKVQTHYVVDYQNNITPDMIDRDGKHNLEDTLNVISNNYIAFEIYTKDLNNLRNFEDALVNYVNKSAIMQAKYKAHHEMLERELEICDNQLNYLDSLSKRFYYNYSSSMQINMDGKGDNLIFGKQSVDPLHEDILDLVQHMKGVEFDLSTCTQPMLFVSHLSAMPKAINNRMICLLFGILIGWIVGLCFAWAIEDRQLLFQWFSKK